MVCSFFCNDGMCLTVGCGDVARYPMVLYLMVKMVGMDEKCVRVGKNGRNGRDGLNR